MTKTTEKVLENLERFKVSKLVIYSAWDNKFGHFNHCDRYEVAKPFELERALKFLNARVIDRHYCEMWRDCYVVEVLSK